MQDLHYDDFKDEDWPEVWSILEPVFREGASYPCAIDISEQDARHYWVETPTRTILVRSIHGDLLGTYYVRPDQLGLGSHICNCGYIVADRARGNGFASRMCMHSQKTAQKDGFLGMKFNLVVETNLPAIKAWTQCGLKIIGTTPNAFRHQDHGFVAAHIMYKELA